MPVEEIPAIPLWLDLLAVAVGALSASATAENVQSKGRRIDWLGVAILGVAVGLGGGMLRDFLLGVPPATLQSDWYILNASGSALVGMWLAHALRSLNWVVTALDAASLGLFAIIGTSKAIAFGVDPLPAIMIGTVAAAGGGAVRDILLQMPVGVLYAGTFYAAAAFVGTAAFVLVHLLGGSMLAGMLVCWFLTVGIRLASVKWGLSLPEQMALRRRSSTRSRRADRRMTQWGRRAGAGAGAEAAEGRERLPRDPLAAAYTGPLPIIELRRDERPGDAPDEGDHDDGAPAPAR